MAVHDFRKGAGDYEGAEDVDDDSSSEDSDDDSDDDKEASAQAADAGAELAGLLTGDLDKSAVDGMVQDTLEDVIKVASDDADRVAVFLANYNDELQKQAEGVLPPVAPEAEAVASEEVPSGGEEALVEDMLGGGAAEAPMMEAPAEGGGELEELAAILEELGIAPEELEAAMAAEGAGGPEGLPPEAGGGLPPEALGGLPPEVAGAEEQAAGLEVAASDKHAAAKKGNAMAGVRDYIQEIIKRSKNA